MARTTRIAILFGTMLILVAGTAFATQVVRPDRTETLADEPETPASADDLAHAIDRLKAAGIDATSDQLESLSADYGLGGAVRLLAWADATGMSLSDLRALRDDGAGWGQIAHDLGVSPGIGSVMGQGAGAADAHGRDSAPGQQKPKPDGADEDEAAESPGD
ncbi:MAG TPA: hypothetical protein VJY85_05505 [Candidatus Limnocylindria bacterium]|nr:hypothetical protein [Candidatus Limnocylindria bacterium]